MSELVQVLAGDSAHTPPANILEKLTAEDAHREIAGAPHTIYDELWHITYWQQVTLDWVRGIETPVPDHASAGFPSPSDMASEDWEQLGRRFARGNEEAVAVAREDARLDAEIVCPSRPGLPVRLMTIREQLESLGAHNSYHFGRIVLLRQLMGLWPPPSGSYAW